VVDLLTVLAAELDPAPHPLSRSRTPLTARSLRSCHIRTTLTCHPRFNKLLYVVDTCQANTMFSKFYSPNIISTGSSSLGENSYSVSDLTQPTSSSRLVTNTRDTNGKYEGHSSCIDPTRADYVASP
jgi:hypothetical protein